MIVLKGLANVRRENAEGETDSVAIKENVTATVAEGGVVIVQVNYDDGSQMTQIFALGGNVITIFSDDHLQRLS